MPRLTLCACQIDSSRHDPLVVRRLPKTGSHWAAICGAETHENRTLTKGAGQKNAAQTFPYSPN